MTSPLTPTPDDGVRHSAEVVWDEAARPRAPRGPERILTAQEQQSGQHLIDVHDHLRSELTQVRDLVDQVTGGGLGAGAARSAISELTVRQNNWTTGAYCQSYCRVLTVHHSIEDQGMFPHLRRADPRLVPVIDRLEAEHLVIHEVLERLDRALVAFVAGPDAGQVLRDAVDLLTDTLLSHLSYEERELVEPLARLGMM
jgi:Hemerythrin HHE cation binding domain